MSERVLLLGSTYGLSLLLSSLWFKMISSYSSFVVTGRKENKTNTCTCGCVLYIFPVCIQKIGMQS